VSRSSSFVFIQDDTRLEDEPPVPVLGLEAESAVVSVECDESASELEDSISVITEDGCETPEAGGEVLVIQDGVQALNIEPDLKKKAG